MDDNWKKIISPDGKKNNFSSPDALKYYWRDFQKEPKSIFKRNFDDLDNNY